jgi:hypothetical protein
MWNWVAVYNTFDPSLAKVRREGLSIAEQDSEVQHQSLPGQLSGQFMERLEQVLENLWWWEPGSHPLSRREQQAWWRRVPPSVSVARLQYTVLPRALPAELLGRLRSLHEVMWRRHKNAVPNYQGQSCPWWEVMRESSADYQLQHTRLPRRLSCFGLERVWRLLQKLLPWQWGVRD